MIRVDYIRIPGNEWIADPENRFTTVDMRGSLIELVQRTFSAIADDLPKGFLLPEGQLQAESIGLPSKVLREAIVNAFMHRTYRVNQPIQIIRYGNRIEIKNPGFSLKPEDQLGEPGSKNRNPHIAAIFHETNLAETKGSGIKTMKALMYKAGMVPPTFESNHGDNQFLMRLLLHHFLSEEDVTWLQEFKRYDLNDSQKHGLIFLREAGAIDNSSYRQINGLDILKASVELRALRDMDLLEQKGKGRYTYYIKGFSFLNAQITPPGDQITPPGDQITPPNGQITLAFPELKPLPTYLQLLVNKMGKKASSAEVEEAILEMCKWRPLTLDQLAGYLNRDSKHLLRSYIKPLRDKGKLKYTKPDLPNHPEQGYITVET